MSKIGYLILGFVLALATAASAGLQGIDLRDSNTGVTGPLGVGNGGLGAAGLSGILRGNGASPADAVTGLSVTKTVRASGGASDCTLIFTSGVLTGGSC